MGFCVLARGDQLLPYNYLCTIYFCFIQKLAQKLPETAFSRLLAESKKHGDISQLGRSHRSPHDDKTSSRFTKEVGISDSFFSRVANVLMHCGLCSIDYLSFLSTF